MINISKKARLMLQQQGADENRFVRVIVKSGGCAGMTYDAEIDSVLQDTEKVVYENSGISVVSDTASLAYLEGLNIDYSDDLISAGFRFSNNTNKSSCGCGASFAVPGLTGFPELTKGGASCDH